MPIAAFAESLNSMDSALVQLELPAGETLPEVPTTARVQTLANEQPIPARYIGRAPSVNPATQGNAFLFLVTSNQTHLAPGASVTGLIGLTGEPLQGVMMPRSAIVRAASASWAVPISSITMTSGM